MSHFSAVHRRTSISGGLAIYDNRHGTATDSTGWITYALHSGNRRIWVDSISGSDSNDGLSAATAKQTFAAAYALFTNGSFAAGDQLMVAGTGGRSYTDPGTNTLGKNFTGYNGISLAYPVAVLCYDPASPSDSTKYGKLLGDNRPVIDVSSTSGTPAFRKSTDTGNTDHYFAIQGIIFDAMNVVGQALEHDGRHDGMVVQNVTWRSIEYLLNNASSIYGASQNCHVSKCSFYGAWANDGNSAGLFDHGTDALWVTDCIFGHCGWKIGASRDDSTTIGGVHTGGQGHSHYHHATSTNFRCMRNVYFDDSADGLNARGDVIASDLVTIAEPIALTIGGFSGSTSERPEGVLSTLDNFLVIDGAALCSTQPRGLCFNIQNTLPGSYSRNGVLIYNSQYGLTNNEYAAYNDTSGGTAPSYAFLFDKIRGYNYSPTLQGTSTQISVSWTNNIIDVSAAALNGGTTSGNSISSGATFPLAKTKAQIYTAMGFASQAAIFNAMLDRPEKQWAQALLTIGLAAYGTSSTTSPSVSPPDMTGITPVVVY